MSPGLIRGITAAIAIILIVGFGFLYGAAIYKILDSKSPEPIKFDPAYVYVATALAGLVGGVAAMIFNEKLPDDTAAKQANPAESRTTQFATPSATGPTAAWRALVRAVTPLNGESKMFAVVSFLYVVGYFLIGVAAIITWVVKPDVTADLVKNLALISIGLFVAIARSFFHLPKPKPKP